eukprot:scaffold27680_cov33-Tisochrysis_lutea.AAC.2
MEAKDLPLPLSADAPGSRACSNGRPSPLVGAGHEVIMRRTRALPGPCGTALVTPPTIVKTTGAWSARADSLHSSRWKSK